MRSCAAWNLQSVFAFLQLRAHGAKIGGDGRDAVRFFHAQLLSIPNFDSLLRVRGNRCQHRNLVNQRRGIGSRDDRALQLSALNLQRARQFAMLISSSCVTEMRSPICRSRSSSRARIGFISKFVNR